jgi:hypothetical protein
MDKWFLYYVCISKCSVENSSLDIDKTCSFVTFYKFLPHIGLRHTSTMQFLVMGYSGNVLCARFIPEKIWERQATLAPVMVKNTRKRQKALARMSTAGGVFFLTGG